MAQIAFYKCAEGTSPWKIMLLLHTSAPLPYTMGCSWVGMANLLLGQKGQMSSDVVMMS